MRTLVPRLARESFPALTFAIGGAAATHAACIAEVKREMGPTRGHAWNRGRGRGAPLCPPWAREAIRRCLYDDDKGKPQKEEDV